MLTVWHLLLLYVKPMIYQCYYLTQTHDIYIIFITIAQQHMFFIADEIFDFFFDFRLPFFRNSEFEKMYFIPRSLLSKLLQNNDNRSSINSQLIYIYKWEVQGRLSNSHVFLIPKQCSVLMFGASIISLWCKYNQSFF